MATWQQIQLDPNYQNLTPLEKRKFKMDYFDSTISKDPDFTNLSQPEKNKFKTQFLDISKKRKRPEEFLPTAGQFVGGLAGYKVGLGLGHPYIGGAVGGTLGRTIGRLQQEKVEQAQRSPMGFLTAFAPPPYGDIMALKSILAQPQKRKVIAKELGITAATEAVLAPVGAGLTRGLSWTGRKVMQGLLGTRIAQRGAQRGWKRILDPEFWQRRVPFMIADKMDKFFSRLTNVTGKRVEKAIKVADKTVRILPKFLKEKVLAIIPRGTGYTNIYQYIDDLALKSNVERTLLKNETRKILMMGGKSRKVSTLWAQRRELDKLINSKAWGDDAVKYLNNLRAILNAPIKSSSDDVAKAFGKYQFVKEGEYDLGKNFIATRDPSTGEIYSSQVETYATNILKTSRDDLIRRLKDLDKILGADDQIIEKFLDYAAAEGLERGIGIGILQEIFASILFGARKGLAYIGRTIQTPAVQWGKRVIGRTIPTAISETLPTIVEEERK